MNNANPIAIVDLFAGPGGLGEGFSSLENGNAFRIVTSAEKDPCAHQTLLLRAFYRAARTSGRKYLNSYYAYCRGETDLPWDTSNKDLWEIACKEAKLIELGTESGNIELETALKNSAIGPQTPWVLIGGPPCQAYSVVGRSRNRGKGGYVAENDHRHFLYKEYLSVIKKFSPSIFVMENVKGILSSKINGEHIFHSILKDLSSPNGKGKGQSYRIHSLVTDTFFTSGTDINSIDPRDYIIKAEEFGIPQARHRVILLGIRNDLEVTPKILEKSRPTTVYDAIHMLPSVRGSVSTRSRNGSCEYSDWISVFKRNLKLLLDQSKQRPDLEDVYNTLAELDIRNMPVEKGAMRIPYSGQITSSNETLNNWYADSRLGCLLNHEARSHMGTDLCRYLYAGAYSKTRGKSPRGHKEFDLNGLAPDHKNWGSGKFIDRFRVQQYEKPATTITSHISKDGHYFIHPDPMQCRSLTVREAARIQTFPDNYFFQGNRTQQYHQVGNAVPPLLAHKIAKVVYEILKETAFRI
jgi:DNA (cytosine-5)-methyltransferase 1